MTERQIEKQKETEAKKEHNNLVELPGIIREDIESKHCYYKVSDSKGRDSTAINERRRKTTTKGEGDDNDNIIKVGIRINNKYASLVPELTREEYELLKKSIKQEGLWVPLIVNQDGVLLDGHHRYKVCQELNIEPHYNVKEFKNEFYEKLFVIDCNIKRRQLNSFQRVKLALKSKSIKEEIAWKNSQSNLKQNSSHLPTDRNLTVGSNDASDSSNSNSGNDKNSGRVDEQIGDLACVSRDTVRKVEKILQCIPEENEIMQKLRTGEMSINQAYELISKEQHTEQEQEQQYLTTPFVTSDNIIEDSSSTFTSKASSRPLAIKEEEYKPIQPLEKSKEEDIVKNQNYQMKQEIQSLRERINYLEQINQQEEWSRTYVFDLQDGPMPLKITVNSVKQEIVSVEIDDDYIKKKNREARERYQQLEQKEQKEEEKEIRQSHTESRFV
jgi:ParB-like nuclease family protein